MLRAMDGSTDSPCPAGRNLVDLVNLFLRGLSGCGVGLNLDYVYTPSSRHSSSELDSVLDFRSSVDLYKVSLASRDGFYLLLFFVLLS